MLAVNDIRWRIPMHAAETCSARFYGWPQYGFRMVMASLLWTCGLLPASLCMGLITGGEGNQPLADPGWPQGAAAVFNWPTRIAWWEGPPLGGGQWHAECKGDAQVLNKVLEKFAEIDAPTKRVIVVDGIGFSFWLDPSGVKRGDRNTKIDWEFTVWVPASWQMQKSFPAYLSSLRTDKELELPVPEIRVYAATVHWNEVRVPAGVKVIDQRLEAHGFNLSDGRVAEGIIADDTTGKPLRATVRAEQIVAKPTGGYDYQLSSQTMCDESGRWVLKNLGDKRSRLVAVADGYAPRVIQYMHYDRQPGWQRMDTTLSPVAEVRGRVLELTGSPLANVKISVRNPTDQSENSYALPEPNEVVSDEQGRFTLVGVPHGTATLVGRREGYVQEPGLGIDIRIPGEVATLTMNAAASLEIHVLFARPRGDAGYIVNIVPEAGEKVGRWSGSAQLDAQDQFHFQNIPPGAYLVSGRPNPGSDSQETPKQRIVLKAGQQQTLTIQAKEE